MAVSLRKVVNEEFNYESKPHAQPARIPNKRILKREIQSRSEYRKTVVLVFSSMATVLFLMGMSYIFVKAGVTRVNWQVQQLTEQNQSIAMENERIKGVIASKKSLDRIETIAINELGMVKEAGIEYMVLSSTLVSEGKIKVQEDLPEPKPDVASPVAAIVDFFLTWKR